MGYDPCTGHCHNSGQATKAILQVLTLGLPLPSPHIRGQPATTPQGNEQGDPLLVLVPSHGSTCPREASHGFLIWPLIHFYRVTFCLGHPRVYFSSPVYILAALCGINGDLHQEDLCHTHVCSTKPYPSLPNPEPLPLWHH